MKRLALALLLCLLPALVGAQSATTNKIKNDVFSGNPNTITLVYPGSSTSGNVSWVAIRGTQGVATVSSVTDSLGTTYSLMASQTSTEPAMWLYAGTHGSSGANTITVTFSATTSNIVWEYAEEVTGVTLTGVVAPAANTGTATDETCTAYSTSRSAYHMMMAGAGVSHYTAGTDSAGHLWTLIDGNIGATLSLGGVQEYIAAGAFASVTPHFTGDDGANPYTALCLALLTPAGGGAAGNNGTLMLMGVGR